MTKNKSASSFGSLYTKGMTQLQLGQMFDESYDETYRKSSISRMLNFVRKEVSDRL